METAAAELCGGHRCDRFPVSSRTCRDQAQSVCIHDARVSRDRGHCRKMLPQSDQRRWP